MFIGEEERRMRVPQWTQLRFGVECFALGSRQHFTPAGVRESSPLAIL